MILHSGVKCKCGHPFSYHVKLPDMDLDAPRSWPVRNCGFSHSTWTGKEDDLIYDYKCLCLNFTITFWIWLKETYIVKSFSSPT